MIISPLLQDFGNPQIMHAMQMDDLMYNCFKHISIFVLLAASSSERKNIGNPTAKKLPIWATFTWEQHVNTWCFQIRWLMLEFHQPRQKHRYHLYTTKLDNSGVLFFSGPSGKVQKSEKTQSVVFRSILRSYKRPHWDPLRTPMGTDSDRSWVPWIPKTKQNLVVLLVFPFVLNKKQKLRQKYELNKKWRRQSKMWIYMRKMIYLTPRLQNVNWPTNSTTSYRKYYCWCKKSCTSWGSLSLDLQGFIHPRWLAGSLPSTVPNTFPCCFQNSASQKPMAIIVPNLPPILLATRPPWQDGCWQFSHSHRREKWAPPTSSYLSNNYGPWHFTLFTNMHKFRFTFTQIKDCWYEVFIYKVGEWWECRNHFALNVWRYHHVQIPYGFQTYWTAVSALDIFHNITQLNANKQQHQSSSINTFPS